MDDRTTCGRSQEKMTYIKEGLVACVLWGPHAGASRDNHLYFCQVNVAFTACVLTRVIVSQLEPKGYRWDVRDTQKETHTALPTVSEPFPLYLSKVCLEE